MKVVAISGYFNPLHAGHLDYIEAAKKLGDKLVVIINNDKQVVIKGSKPFMKEEDRIRLVNALREVDEAVLSVDEDATVCKSLELVKPDIFANGGDRTKENVPENDICKELGIKQVFNVGGKKVIIDHIHEGESLGELSFFDHHTRSATARAVGKVGLMQFKEDRLMGDYEDLPDYFKVFLEGMALRMRTLIEKITLLTTNPKIFELLNEESKGKIK